MKLDITFPKLIEQQQKVGASNTSRSLESSDLDPREQIIVKLEKGIDVSLQDVVPEPGGLLSYEGEHIIIYIMDTKRDRQTLQYSPENAPKFHLCDCEAIIKMRERGRFYRYVATRRTDGMFRVFWRDEETSETGEMEAKLNVCRYCLRYINWHEYEDVRRSKKNEIVSNFSIAEFLLDYATFFHVTPKESDNTSVPRRYVQNWPKISKNRRKDAGWRCEQCNVHLEGPLLGWLLHCHHENGDVLDNRRQNLRVLCALCHSEQFMHDRMKVSSEARSAILEQRRAQGLR